MVNLEKALTVDGWMSESELRWLSEQAQHGVVVEIGSWTGRTTRAMADSKIDGMIYAVDTWEGSEENQDFLKDKPKDYLFQEFCKNLSDHIARERVIPMRVTSLAAADFASRMGIKFDFVFIDAAHDYESVKEDILAWRPLVRRGGVLAGHDYDWGYPGVVHAVRELISQTPQQAAGGSSIWFERQL
jgi:predicted O-methyltransferase YrrM